MSRETDSPSPRPLGWDPQRSEGEDGAAAGAPQPEEKQTETTLTTRARINIPGSRPIPPIVVRETVDETAAHGTPLAAGAAPPGVPAGPAPGGRGSRKEGKKKTSSWFEPRRPPRDANPGPEPAATPGAGPAPGPGPGLGPGPATQPTPVLGTGPGGLAPGSGARRGDTPPDGIRGLGHPTGPAAGPPVSETPAAGIPGLGRSAPSWFHPTAEAPPPGATPPDGTPVVPQSAAGSGLGPAGEDPALPPDPLDPLGPSGPTTGPVSGSMPLLPPPADELASITMDLGGPFPPAPPPVRTDAELSATGALPVFTDDADGPAVPPSGPSPEPRAEDEPPAPAPAAPAKRRGRSRLRLALVALAGVGVIAYGAGLLLNSDDVPKGTTVLGVDIGGSTSQEAVNRLDAAMQRANNEPLTLLIGGQEVELKPSVAGLAVDTEATIRAVSGQDYAPLPVIGSLFGAERTENAVFSVDQEKLTVALEDIAAQTGGGDAPIEGSVTFENGEAIGTPGQPGSAVDVAAAADAVESAFRERAATGRDPEVALPVTEQEPLVTEAEVQRALEEFAEPAMSGYIWVVAGDAPPLPFDPNGTLDDLLSMEPSQDGTLQPVIDTEALAEAYGSYFDGVMIDAGSGLVELTPEHVAAAMIPVLRETATVDDGEGRREAVVEGAVGP